MKVEVIIRNKRVARDPEGETIYEHLIKPSKYGEKVKGVRSGKWLLIEVEGVENVKEFVEKMLKELRIYNPVVHEVEIRLDSGSEVPRD